MSPPIINTTKIMENTCKKGCSQQSGEKSASQKQNFKLIFKMQLLKHVQLKILGSCWLLYQKARSNRISESRAC